MAVVQTVSIDDAAVIRLLDRMGRNLAALAPALADVGEYLVETTEDRFRTQRDPDGRPWPEVSPATRRRKRHPKILTESHNLRSRFVRDVDGSSVTVSNNVAYAAAQQFGVDQEVRVRPHVRRYKGRNVADGDSLLATGIAFVKGHTRHMHLVDRRYLGINADDRAEITDRIRDHVLGRM